MRFWDGADEKILELMKGNARLGYQELGDVIGMTQVAVKKRVEKLEREGVIRGYNTCIYRAQDYLMAEDKSSEGDEDDIEFDKVMSEGIQI